jgi:hypothetical protein
MPIRRMTMSNEQDSDFQAIQEPNTKQDPKGGIIQVPEDEVMDNDSEEEAQEPNTL